MINAQRGIDTVLLSPQAVTNGATATANWTVAGADYAEIRIMFKAELNTNAVGPTVSLLASDDTVVTNFATITADQSAIDLTAAKELRYCVDLRGKKKLLRLAVTPATATNDTVTVCAVGTLTRNYGDPASTTAMGDDTVVIV